MNKNGGSDSEENGMEVDSYCLQNDNVFSISTKQQPNRDGVSQRKTPEFRDKKNLDAILD